ncbi:MAG TPA: YbhB/YbcL family Raf kinase inhibitor-like protein [bacterium]|nr:YbhB/YbcL family Raf kinase inhibitor-like protein [bacterium]HPN67323.1 YbhB/YbcL family Raf kinase inhibitor-like protein [bacterium]
MATNNQPNLSLISSTMKITSPSFDNGQKIPAKFTCDGENINPALNITNVPENARSLVLIVDDPDAPMGTWTHWTLWNITPASQIDIAENSQPNEAIAGNTSSGQAGYDGPCPPNGTHHYYFKIYALDDVLNLSANANVEQLVSTMNDHIIDYAELIGIYTR